MELQIVNALLKGPPFDYVQGAGFGFTQWAGGVIKPPGRIRNHAAGWGIVPRINTAGICKSDITTLFDAVPCNKVRIVKRNTFTEMLSVVSCQLSVKREAISHPRTNNR